MKPLHSNSDVMLADRRVAVGRTGIQRQVLLPAIVDAVAPGCQFSLAWVDMPPGAVIAAHAHALSDIAIVVLGGNAATLAGHDLTPIPHGPGQILWLRAGLPHVAVNLSATTPVHGLEVRGRGHLDDDTLLLPELETLATRRAHALRVTRTQRPLAATA